MKDIRCLFGCHIYSQAEAKVVDERKGYLIARVNMFCTRCGKSYEDIIAIPFPEWLQQKSAQPTEKTFSEMVHLHDAETHSCEDGREQE